MSFIVNGQARDIPGVSCLSWRDNAELRVGMPDDGRIRRGKVRAVCLHTTKGWPDRNHPAPQDLRPGLADECENDLRTARYWAKSDKTAGAHLVADMDGTWACLADLGSETTYHAKGVNDWTVGIEIYQGGKAELYEGQLASVVVVVQTLCDWFGIPRRVPGPYRRRTKDWIVEEKWQGVFGHRDVSDNRGFGDPGDFVFEKLAAAGFEVVDR